MEIDVLNDDRNLVAHESTLWCDLRMVVDDPRKYEVLIGEIHSVEPAQYRALASYGSIRANFMYSLAKLGEWMLRQIEDEETISGAQF